MPDQPRPNEPKPMPPYRPGDPPPSEDELAGIVGNGPCRSFKPMEWPWEYMCRKCGFPHR